ncbi:hypothetical protein RYO59_000179 [Thermosynechococcaceae cyanobacterium Okahandja]
MSEPRLLEVARQGDPGAIRTLLNAVLLPKQVKAEVSRQATTLAITLHSEKMLNQGAAVTLIRTALEKLHLPDIEQVVVESRVLGAPLWDADFRLRSPVPSQTPVIEPPPPEPEPFPPVADPWQPPPEPAPETAPLAGEALPPPSAAEPDAPTLMDLMAAFVESTAPEPVEPLPAPTDSTEDITLSDLAAALHPEHLPPAAESLDVSDNAPDVAELERPETFDITSEVADLEALDSSDSVSGVSELEPPETFDITPDVADLETPETFDITSEVAELETLDSSDSVSGVSELESPETFDITSDVAELETLDSSDSASEVAELEPLDGSDNAPEVMASEDASSSYPPLGDPWLEADPSPAPEPAKPPETPPASAPSSAASPQETTQETTAAEYTIPTIEKVPRDGQSKVAGVAGMVMGLGFCATGLGTVIGLPMVVGGMWMLGDEEVWRGECPHCRQTLKVPVGKLWRFSCPSCQGLIEIKHGRFYRRSTP